MNPIGILQIKGLLNNDRDRNLALENSEEVISRLKFLGKIQKDERIDVKRVIRQENNFFTTLTRTFIYPDNRHNTMRFINQVIDRSFEILDTYIHNKKADMVESLVVDLLNCESGLNNLKYTYRDDTKMCCDIEVLLNKIKTTVKNKCDSSP